jgi:hypothetical protein
MDGDAAGVSSATDSRYQKQQKPSPDDDSFSKR